MSWLGGRTSDTTSGLVIQPPPGDTIMFPTSVSSSVSSRSFFRKYGSPRSAKIWPIERPSRRSISRSKSRNVRPSLVGHGLPDRRLPRSGKPDEDQVRLRRISRRAGLRRAKGRRHSSVSFRRANRRRTSRGTRRRARTRASPSAMTPMAGTAVTSLRSATAAADSPVATSTSRADASEC